MNKNQPNMARQLYSNFMCQAGKTSEDTKKIYTLAGTEADDIVVLSNCQNTDRYMDIKNLQTGELNLKCTAGRKMKYSVLVTAEDYSTIISGNEVSSVIKYVEETFNNHYAINNIDDKNLWLGIKMPELKVTATSNGEFVTGLLYDGKFEYKISPNLIDDNLGKALDPEYESNFDKALNAEPQLPTF